MSTPFESPATRFCIGSIDDTDLPDVIASYNPKELQYDRAVPLTAHRDRELEFGGTQGRTLRVELFFDGFEQHASVAPQVDMLETLATVIDPDSSYGAARRPHFCVAIWGDAGLPRMCCVIESVQAKYTMFARKGMPLRAVCTVVLKEASVLLRTTRLARDKKLAREASGF
jgi:hypothetical protein